MESGREKDTVARSIGRYTLFREVAHGGMATVHLGRLRGVGGFARTVAIKRLHPPFARDPEFVSMFLDEARLAARIQHPNVVPVLDVVAAEGELFLVMDYVHGESLSSLLKRARANKIEVPPRIVAGIVIDLLYGLHAAHEARTERGDPLGIVHRDVSPQNVLVGVDGVARVLDFGVAKAGLRAHASTRSGYLKGKLAYMAPEQVATRQVDRRTDVYAAAVVLWEALTGERLFPSLLDTRELMAQILTRDHPPPSQHKKGLPAGLDEMVLRGLAREPEQRYATAHDMAAELERIASPATPREIGAWVKEIAEKALTTRAASIAEIEVVTLADAPAVRRSRSSFPPVLEPSPEREPGATADVTTFEELESAELQWAPSKRLRVVARWLAAGAVALVGAGLFSVFTHWSATRTIVALRGRAAAQTAPESPLPMAPTIPSSFAAATNGGSLPLTPAPAPPGPSSAVVVSVATPTTPPTLPTTAPSSLPRPTTRPPNLVRAAAAAVAGPERTREPQGDCQPPYTVDARGVRIPKRWCS